MTLSKALLKSSKMSLPFLIDGFEKIIDQHEEQGFMRALLSEATLASFQIGGKVSESSDFWKRCFRIGGVDRFVRMIWSGPAAFCGFRLKRSFCISNFL